MSIRSAISNETLHDKRRTKMETRYLVMKISDMLAADLTKEESQSLFDIVDKVNKSREENMKPPLQCVVVESDWPEYKPVCDSIEARIAGNEDSSINTLLDKYAAKCNESNVRGPFRVDRRESI